MKTVVKSALVMSSMVLAGAASACCSLDSMQDLKPYVGLEYKQTWMKGNNDWAKVLTQKSLPGANVFIGGRVHDNVGFELGYSATKRKARDFTLNAGTFFGNAVTARTGQTKLQVKGGSFDVNGYLPLDQQVDLLGSVGVGYMKAKLDVTASSNAAPLNTANVSGGKSRTIGRLGLGAQAMVNEWVGVRGVVRWENTKRLRLDNNASLRALNVSNRPFKNATTLSLGAFAKF